MILIAVSGKMGSGKDTFAEMIANKSNLPTYKFSFADNLKKIVEILSGYKMKRIVNSPYVNDVFTFTQEQKNHMITSFGKTIGEMLQELGTNCMRKHFDQNVWINSLHENLKPLKNEKIIAIVPDTRFKNEAHFIHEFGGVVIRMNGDPVKIRENSKRDLFHISETDLDDYAN